MEFAGVVLSCLNKQTTSDIFTGAAGTGKHRRSTLCVCLFVCLCTNMNIQISSLIANCCYENLSFEDRLSRLCF